MCINAFNILDNNLNTIGTGIYLAASVLNHSCVPNATATFDGTTLRVGAITDIEHTDPELVTNNTLNNTNSNILKVITNYKY